MLCGNCEKQIKEKIGWLKDQLLKIKENATDLEQKEAYELALNDCFELIDEAFADLKE